MKDIVQEIRRPISEEFHAYEVFFASLFESDDALLKEVLAYIHSKRGKQIRPTLVLLSAAICRGVTDKTIATAAVVEILHTASLVHDDIVDDSPLRRGSEAVHARWTNKIAVLVGDYLLARHNRVLAQIRVGEILDIMADVSKQLASGELLQLHHGQTMWISERQYMDVIRQKTAELFAAAGAAGAVSSGGTMRQVTALRKYGEHLGMCFQLKDDVLDYSDIDDIGKPTMGDIRDGKATLPLLIALQRAPKQEADLIRESADALAANAPHIDPIIVEQELKSFVQRYDGIRYAYRIMQQHRKQALEALACFADGTTKKCLEQLLDYAIQRVF